MSTRKKAANKVTRKKATRKKATRKKVAAKVAKKNKTLFYDFRQNNSGGSFHFDAKRGISVSVIVEAYSPQDANDRAHKIGLYFDGDDDCSCCGNRWHEQYEGEKGTPVPTLYGEKIKPNDKFDKKGSLLDNTKWMEDSQYEGFIHYIGKPFKGFGKR